ncbi:MAG: DNA polymerase III subunit gamma/tau [Paludibacteraceae bacterium]|nr:DNA polymerase III subunit gamma/tau [Paludibacteraceae bacterium]
MSDYIVSARKYRPTTFESVVGQKALTETLRNAIRQNHLAHAYLFCGPRGVGKTTCARIFAKTINCLNPTAEHDACNECESCVAFNEQRSFNIHELDAASNNSVEDIRTLIQEVRIPPQVGKYSVYIIDEVHMLSQGAFNALLKTLEEPPSYAVFILATTEKHKVLPTILSRCQVYDFQRITIMDIIRHLEYVAKTEGVQAEQEALRVVAEKADGGMRDALSIFDQLVAFCGNTITHKQAIEVLNVLDTDYYFRLTDYALQNKVPEALLLLNEVLQKGFDAGHFITGLMQHLRNVLVAKDAQTLSLLETSDTIQKQYMTQAQQCEAQWLFRALDILNTLDVNYRTAKNKRLTVELALVKWVAPVVAPVLPSTPVAPATPVKTPVAPVKTPAQPAQPVQSAAPAPAPKPAPKPSVGMPKLPSLNMAQVTETPAPAEEPTQPKEGPQNTPFTRDRLLTVWAGLKAHFPKEDRLQRMLTDYTPVITGDNMLTLTLANPWQKEEFGSFGKQIMTIVRKELQNDLVKLQVTVEEYVKEQQAYTSQEKYKLLVQQNPALQEMREALNLQLE